MQWLGCVGRFEDEDENEDEDDDEDGRSGGADRVEIEHYPVPRAPLN